MFPVEEPTAKQVGFVALLKNRSFMALWMGQLLSQVADKILLTLLIALLAVYPTATGTENSMRAGAVCRNPVFQNDIRHRKPGCLRCE